MATLEETLSRMTPAQRSAWEARFGPAPIGPRPLGTASGPPPVGALPNASGPPPVQNASLPPGIDPSWVAPRPIGPPPPPPPPAPEPPALGATIAAANRAPTGAPPGSLFNMQLRPEGTQDPAKAPQPKNGDWAGHNRTIDEREAQRKRENLDGATFFDPQAAGVTATGAPALRQVSAGGRMPASWTTQTQKGLTLSPETREAASDAEGNRMDAAMSSRRAGEMEAEREIGFLQRHEQYQEARERQMRQRADQQRQSYEGELGKLREMQRAADENKFDPKEITPDIASAIGALVGGLAQGMAWAAGNKGATNPGMETLNRRIQDRINAQRMKAVQGRERLEDQRSLLGQMARTFGDERQAEAAAWDAYLGVAETRLKTQMSESKVDWVRAKYRDAIATIQGERARRVAQWDEATQDKVQTSQHDVNAPAQYAGAAPLKDADRKETAEVAKLLTEKGIPQARSQLEDIDRQIETFGNEDIPGIGLGADIAFGVGPRVGAAIYGDKAVAGRQAVAAVKNGIRKSIAGASLTDSEKAELNKQLEGAGDSRSLRQVVQSFRSSLNAQERTIRSVGSDVANAEQKRREGAASAYAVPLDRGAAPHVREAK